jgi:TonB family protein
MMGRLRGFLICCTLSGAILITSSMAIFAQAGGSPQPAAKAQPAGRRLESFYATISNSEIVHVERAGAGVTVRVIEIVTLDEICFQDVVLARDVALPDTPIDAAAGVPLCTLPQERATSAFKRARLEEPPQTIDGGLWGLAAESIVAVCDGRERRFSLEYFDKHYIDPERLQRLDPTVHALWSMRERVKSLARRTAGAAWPSDAEAETLGTRAAADLLAGRYDGAYGDRCIDNARKKARCHPPYWRQEIGDYAGPPVERGPRYGELFDRTAWRFTHYVAPEFNVLAARASLQGDVLLRLRVDSATGAVTQSELVKSRPLLGDDALRASRQWRFEPGSTPVEPFEMTLSFKVTCPNRVMP